MNKTLYLLVSLLCFATFCVGMIAKTADAAKATPSAGASCTYKVNFQSGKLIDVIKSAQNSHKLLFAATDSRRCGSCDVFACDVFNNPEVVNLLNNNFVNMNLNLDEQEYFHLRGSQELGAHPAFLVFSSNGYLIDKISDLKDAKQLVAQANEILKRYGNIDIVNLKSDRDKYAMGERDPDFLYNLAFKMKSAGYYYNTVVSDYFRTQTIAQLQLDKNRTFIYEFSDNVENAAINHFLDDLNYFKSGLGSERANEHVKMAVRNSIAAAITDRDQHLFSKAKEISEKAYLPKAESFMYYIQSEYYEGIGDWENFASITTKYVQDYKITDPEFLNTVALKYFLFVTEPRKLKNAENWLLESIGIESEFDSNFLLARLYRKMGECKKARDYAINAIEIAQIRNTQGYNIDYNEAGRFLDNLANIGCRDPQP